MARGDEQTHDGRARGWQSADGMNFFSFWTYGTAAPLPHWATLLHHYQTDNFNCFGVCPHIIVSRAHVSANENARRACDHVTHDALTNIVRRGCTTRCVEA